MSLMSARRVGLGMLLATSMLASPAFAQRVTTLLPVREFLDENGVDLATGIFHGPSQQVAIGGENGISFVREFNGSAAHDSLMGAITSVNQAGSNYNVVFKNRKLSFTASGSNGPIETFTPDEQNGQTLTLDTASNIYTFTDSDGAVATFLRTDYTWGNPPHGIAIVHPILSVTYPSGKTLTFNYRVEQVAEGTGRRLQSVTSNTGYQMQFTYEVDTLAGSSNADQWSHIVNVTAFNSLVESCPTNANGCTFTQTWPSLTIGPLGSGASQTYTDSIGRTTTYVFGGVNGLLSAVQYPQSPNTADIDVSWDANGDAQSVTKEGVTTSYGYSTASTLLTVTATRAGATKTFKIDTAATQLISSMDELGRETTYSLDPYNRIQTITFPELNTVTKQFDSRGNVTSVTKAPKPGSGLTNVVTSSVFPTTCTNVITCNSPTSTTDERGQVTIFEYDSTHGGILSITHPAPSSGGMQPQERFSYSRLDANGSSSSSGVAVLTGVSQCQTQAGSVGSTPAACVGTADETKRTIAYGQNLLPNQVTDQSGDGAVLATETMGYDSVGNLLTVDGPLSGSADTTRNRYDAAGQLVGTVSPDPDGAGALKPRAIRTTYNSIGEISKVEIGTVNSQSDADWASMSVLQTADLTYDANWRQVKQSLTAGGSVQKVVQQSYDSSGRPECIAQRMNLAAFGSLPSSACTLGAQGSFGPDRITKTVYDAAGEVTKVQTAFGVAGQQRDVATSAYSANGKLATLTDAENNMTTYEYDGFDRLSKTRYPVPTQGGLASSTTDYEQVGYDVASNVTSKRLRSGSTIIFGYDNLSRLTSKDLPGTDPGVSYAYDNLGRLTSMVQPGNSLSFTYDALSRNLSQVGPLGTVGYTYDAASRRTSMTYPGSGLAVFYEYLTTGEVTKIRENDPTTGTVLGAYTYDDLGNRTLLTRADGTTSSYGFDPLSRLTSLTENVEGASTTNDLTLGFTYSPSSQMGTVTRSNDNYSWTGHVNVNRDYTNNGLNQVTATSTAPAVNFAYDANGNLNLSGPTTYSYDSENRLISANGTTCFSCSGSATLAYDPAGRLFQTVGSTTTRFAYDGQDLIAEYDGSNSLLRRYVHGPGPDEPLAWYEGASTTDRRFYHADERGSVFVITNSAGNVLNSYSYDEYGLPGQTNSGRFQYTGQTWLPEIGMYYYKSRLYSPSLGRFMQTDRVGYISGMNLYEYVRDDPVNSIDPNGRCDHHAVTYTWWHANDKNQPFHRLLEWTVYYDTDCGNNGGAPGQVALGGRSGDQPQPCLLAWTPDGDSKGENPKLGSGGYKSDLPGALYDAEVVFRGLGRLAKDDYVEDIPDFLRPDILQRSYPSGIQLRIGSDLRPRIDIPANTFTLGRAETIHFKGGKGDMCPTP